MKRRLAGYSLIVVGTILLPLPGPGLAIIAGGLALLSSSKQQPS